jgi:hypothetical protein
MIVRDFQSVIGREARRQILKHEGRLPDAYWSPASMADPTRSGCSIHSSRTSDVRMSVSRRPDWD